ncbi:MAG: tetratricopeptide repeat protein [Candidatus Marinimicrobia bacterium]|nr:tetratricopeptide repeat protein [Candidatus Neomarinimicrobiota bacterium]
MKKQLRHLWLISIFFTISCAYFNTFYNAQSYFDKAEDQRLEKLGQKLPNSVLDAYGKSIKRCQKVINDYPESRFRIPAMMLMSKARYYRSEYKSSLEQLQEIKQSDRDEYAEEVDYWIALCKWRLGKVQFALDALHQLSEISKSRDLKSRCLLSRADINLELSQDSVALEELEAAAELARNNTQKSQIYTRLADLAFKKGDYEKALSAFKGVVKASLSRTKIENSHLQILKIYRIQGDYKTATRKIKSMLADEKFKKIAGQLDLELVQLYIAQGEMAQAETRLQSIVNDYQRSAVSAEAYYLLGQIMIESYWDLEKADEYYGKVGKEYNKTPFKFLASEKQKDIQLYTTTRENIIIWVDEQSNPDTLNTLNDTTEVEPKLLSDFDPAEAYYLLADLEAFKFNRLDSSLIIMDKIQTDFTESAFYPKSLFTSIFIHNQLGDSSKSQIAKNNLVLHFPNSEYAYFLSEKVNTKELEPIEIKFKNAESYISTDMSRALLSFIEITKTDSSDELSASAGYYLGHHYDWINVIPDSAVKYYSWVSNHHSNTDQGKSALNRLNTILSVLADTLAQDISLTRDSTILDTINIDQ